MEFNLEDLDVPSPFLKSNSVQPVLDKVHALHFEPNNYLIINDFSNPLHMGEYNKYPFSYQAFCNYPALNSQIPNHFNPSLNIEKDSEETDLSQGDSYVFIYSEEDSQDVVEEALLLLKTENAANSKKAITLLQKAFEKGNLDAAFSLGEISAKEGELGHAKWYFMEASRNAKEMIKKNAEKKIQEITKKLEEKSVIDEFKKLVNYLEDELEKKKLERFVKKFKKKKSEEIGSELERFVNELEKKELEELIQKSVKTLAKVGPLKDGLSNNLPSLSNNLKLKKDELEKVSPLIKSKKPLLSECLRGSYKKLKKEDEVNITKSEPILMINEENKITKSLPILKLDNVINFDNKK